ncbi:MAG: Fic family protein [Spiribacter salinus]|uniref:Fic family protein n=1 Tax=Spiribacter salinus TaxID=1335746 RepID=A0A540VQQ4_9GAMM|nr:MAG: Fic family protein [Spiribacter salinus]
MKLDFEPPTAFQERLAPKGARLAGMAALVHGLDIAAPVRRPCAVAAGHVRGSTREDNGWTVFDKRYWPGETATDHLGFVLRHEWFDPLVLKRVFDSLPPADMEAFVSAAPTGTITRRAWFLYETLTGKTLDLEDMSGVTAVDALDPQDYFTAKPRLSRRHRVRDNLLGTGAYCPVIRRTKALEDYLGQDLAAKAAATVGRTSASLITRAASFLLLADSRASFEIEGERPPRDRLERWGRAIQQAGKNPLTLDELNRLLGVLIEDRRFIHPGLRPDGVFLGERDHAGEPLPEFIGARPDDLPPLMEAMLESNARMRDSALDAVLQATATAFGFVYIHPYQDGNGRLHRCIIHHVLAERGYTPPGMVFPVSSVMLDRIDEYQKTLQGHSAPLMPFIEWRPTPDRNVEVLNDTADLYRYFDCTDEVEFLYSCVARTVEKDLPEELEYLRRHDEAQRRIMATVEMPDRLAQNLIMFVRQNDGRLPKRRREKEFKALSEDEVAQIEAICNEVFGDGNA